MAAAGAPIRVPAAVACRVLGLTPQGYYKRLKSPVSERDWDDAHLIDVLYDLHAGENRVHRLCRIAGITASHHRKKGESRKAGPAPHDDLLAVVDRRGIVRHEFAVTRPNQVSLWDISEHPTRESKLYLCAIKDVRSNRIVGYSIDGRMKSCRDAQRDRAAVSAGTICRSDRGGQFRAKKVLRLLKHHGLVGSMGRAYGTGNNASMESFFALLQKNVLNTHRWGSREDLRLAIVTWIETKYNRRHRQRALGKLTPVEFEMIYTTANAA
jgi:transposase InsO family protein